MSTSASISVSDKPIQFAVEDIAIDLSIEYSELIIANDDISVEMAVLFHPIEFVTG